MLCEPQPKRVRTTAFLAAALRPTLAATRSAVTNGSLIFDGIDHRSAWMRRLRDLIAAHTSDLGGQDLISEAERVLIRRASMLMLAAGANGASLGDGARGRGRTQVP